MTGKLATVIASVAVGVAVAPMAAQNATQGRDLGAPPGRQQVLRPRVDPLRESRYQIGVMERVLEDAVEHGFGNWRDRLQAVLPSQTMLLDNARARGYRLDDYGVFFDVEVPSLETTWFSVLRTLDQNGLALDSALKVLKSHIDASGDTDLEQALKRVELQVAPVGAMTAVVPGRARSQAGSALPVVQGADAPDAADPILSDPEEAYRGEVIRALIDAMLDHGGPLEIGPNEWLTVGAPSGARRNDTRLRLSPLDTNARTIVIRLRGSDLRAFRAGQVARDEAIKRVDVRVF